MVISKTLAWIKEGKSKERPKPYPLTPNSKNLASVAGPLTLSSESASCLVLSKLPSCLKAPGIFQREIQAPKCSTRRLKVCEVSAVTGVPLSSDPPPRPEDPKLALCLGPYGGPRGWVVSYERGTHVPSDRGDAFLNFEQPLCNAESIC